MMSLDEIVFIIVIHFLVINRTDFQNEFGIS